MSCVAESRGYQKFRVSLCIRLVALPFVSFLSRAPAQSHTWPLTSAGYSLVRVLVGQIWICSHFLTFMLYGVNPI